jgi:hypothetical protein
MTNVARRLRPREPIAVMPVVISDRTAPMLFGFKSPRSFREFVRRHAVPYAADGRTILVDVDVLRSKLAELAARSVQVAARATSPEAERVVAPDARDHKDEADDVLAALGIALDPDP